MKKLSVAVAISSLAVGVAHAGVVGHSSNEAKVRVGAVGDAIVVNGEKFEPSHKADQKGNVGIAVINTTNGSKVNNKFVDIANLRATAERGSTRFLMNVGGQDSAGVVQLDMNKWLKATPAPDHSTLGKFSYKELPNNVYFGEWHQASTTSASDKDRTVYYVGKNDGLSVPKSGTATYNVVGINQYNGQVGNVWNGWTGNSTTAAANNLLTGTLNADFAAKTLKGNLTRAVNGGANVTNTLSIAGDIKDKGFVDGTATANGKFKGSVNAQFFGVNANSVAGVATFADKKFDTAFGGSKQ